MLQQHVNQEHQLTRSEELLQQVHQQVKQQQELQKLQQRNPCNHQSQPLQDGAAVSHEKRNIVIFGFSILKGINRKILDQKLLNSKVFYRFYPDATSKYFFFFFFTKYMLQRYQQTKQLTINKKLKKF